MNNKLPSIPLPKDIIASIEQSFVSAKAYGQIATLHDQKIFQRTVHINYHPELKVFFINAHKSSRKYDSALKGELFSGCYWDLAASTQYIWHARPQVLSATDSKPFDLQKSAWQCMRNEVRLAYYLDAENIDLHSNTIKNYPLDQPAPNHDVILFTPHYWDIFQVSQQEHRFSTRTLYHWEAKQWSKQNTSILHTP
ncbi:MAG TPA: hypothetical protein PKC21_04180 [Oligoflexia bacterium]|nr:hypothetical protein [Oligoflexia bacterium]HMR24536.1 hypothetical protein [Oligoflexia bacterium]